ncbi:MAG: response regulator [Fimbriimonadaceae bacterium]|nr:response regulator [Fimbriimonadaceae bacterium]
MIAEDEPLILRSLCFLVDHEGGRAVGVGDGQAALDAVRRERPVALLVDIMMPRLGGLDVCRTLRADAATAALPILVLTALGQREHEALAREAGADHYMRKPFDARALQQWLRPHLAAAGRTPGVGPT